MTQFPPIKKLFISISLSITLIFSFQANALEGGQLASAGQSTGIVGISFDGSFQNCIGVLIEPTRVLTSSSCTFFISETLLASDMRVHPLIGDEIGGSPLVPTLNEDVTPFVGVASYVRHPLNTFSSGSYNLAVLKLAEPLSIGLAKLYNGGQSFVGQQGTAFGWRDFTREGGFLSERFYEANVLQLPAIVDGDSDFESISDGCYDDIVDTDTVFCAGFRNETQFLENDDMGAPMYTSIAGQPVVIGLLTSASGGFLFEGNVDYEEYSRISSMKDFIIQQAPNTIFVDDEVVVDPPSSTPIVTPILQLLLDE